MASERKPPDHAAYTTFGNIPFGHGIVLIDEMENGLYFDTMYHVSESMLKTAIDSQTQLFVTTHSMEYLKVLLPLVNPSEFCLLRTSKENGSSDVDQFDGQQQP